MNAASTTPTLQHRHGVEVGQNALRDCLLAHLRIADAELAVIRNELALIGSALKNRLLTPHEAMQMAYDRDVLDWLFQDKEDAA